MNKPLLYRLVLAAFVAISFGQFSNVSGCAGSEQKKAKESTSKARLISHHEEPAVWNLIKKPGEKITGGELKIADEELQKEVAYALEATQQEGNFLLYQATSCSQGRGLTAPYKIGETIWKSIIVYDPKKMKGYDRFGVKVIKGTVYHELGHCFYGDAPSDVIKPGEDILAYSVPPNLLDHEISEFCDKAKLKEWRADRFAIKHLLKQNDIQTLIYDFNYFLAKHKSTYGRPLSHPSDVDRAELIISKLIRAKRDLFNLPLDKDIQEKFTQDVCDYFPKTLAKANPKLSEQLVKRAKSRKRNNQIVMVAAACLGVAILRRIIHRKK